MVKKAFIILLPFVLLISSCVPGSFQAAEMPAAEIIDEGVNYRLKDNLNLAFEGNLNIPGQAIDVYVKGTLAYLTDDLGQLYIIDFSDLENPLVKGKVKDIHSANIVIVEDGHAYVSYTSVQRNFEQYFTESGFKVVDIRNSESPEVVGEYSSSGSEKWVHVMFMQGEHIFLNTTETINGEKASYLEIIEISNKQSPVLLSSTQIEGSPWGVYVDGDYAYVNTNIDIDDKTQKAMLVIVDISKKEEPVLLGSCEIPPSTSGIFVDGDYAYVSNNTLDLEPDRMESYLQVVDIRDKNNPIALGRCQLPGQGWEIDMVSDYVIVADLEGAVHAVDVSSKEDPMIVDSFYTGGTTYDINIEDGFGYIADGFSGLTVLSLSGQQNTAGPEAGGENRALQANFEVIGDSIGPGKYPTGIPIYFSASSSYGSDGDPIDYRWRIGDEEFSQERLSYVFDTAGNYEIELLVSDGELSDKVTRDIKIEDTTLCIRPIQKESLKVEIEYRLVNLGPGDLNEISCLVSVPQTYNPFQNIRDININLGEYQVIYDQSFNKLLQIDYGDLIVREAEELVAVVSLDLDMISFEYEDLDYGIFDYEDDDGDLFFYTMDDLYIDSDNPAIIDKVSSIIGDESRPVAIIEKLYNYVINLMHYDFRRAEDPRYPLMYASEILNERKGVCADYAVLYVALLRAAGIPSRIASGIPVYTTQLEGGEINMGHAWVEVKFPQFGWVPIDITMEDSFMAPDLNFNLATEKGSGFLHRNMTMDWSSYYFDGFVFSWEGEDMPQVEQSLTYRVIE